jgi:hypothetical protein
MSDASSILILSACTATKVAGRGDPPVLAEDLYAGQQHRRLMRGISAYRDAGQPCGPLELQILSAGHGVIPGDTPLRSYDATFIGMPRARLRRRASRLGVPNAIESLLAQPRKLAVLLLGSDYLHAAQLPPAPDLGAPTLVFTSPRAAKRLPDAPLLHLIALDNRDAQRFSCSLVALKGELAARLLARLAAHPGSTLPLDRAGLLGWLHEDLGARAVRRHPHDLAKAA